MENISMLHPIRGRMVKRGRYTEIGGISFAIIHDAKTVYAAIPGANEDYIQCRSDDSEKSLIQTLEESDPASWVDSFDTLTYKTVIAEDMALHKDYIQGLRDSAKAYQYLRE